VNPDLKQAQQRKSQGPAASISGFEHVMRYWDARRGLFAAKVLPGEFYVTRNEELVVTVLGSCIAACVFAPELKVGGMNHFMLPHTGGNEQFKFTGGPSTATRYGTHAMEGLINEIVKLGVPKNQMQIKLFGGGKILQQMTDVGKRNIDFIHAYLEQETMTAAAEDLGGPHPRKVVLWPQTGRVQVKHLSRLDSGTVVKLESSYESEIDREKVASDVELF